MATVRCKCGMAFRHERDFQRGVCPLCWLDDAREKARDEAKAARRQEGGAGEGSRRGRSNKTWAGWPERRRPYGEGE
jgi:hypothetical protein